MDNLKIGQIINTVQQKDAVHMAIVPMESGCNMVVGAHVRIQNNLAFNTAIESKDAVGIVDPFLKKGVKRGEKFWLFLYPGSITSLRHDWTHPAFGDKEEVKLEEDDDGDDWCKRNCTYDDEDY